MRKALAGSMLLGCALVVSSCSSSPSSPDVTGYWAGSAGNVSLNLTLTQTGQSVTGNGVLVINSSQFGLAASGSMIGANLDLTLASPGYQSAGYSGTLSGKTLDGSLIASGFSGSTLDLAKQ